MNLIWFGFQRVQNNHLSSRKQPYMLLRFIHYEVEESVIQFFISWILPKIKGVDSMDMFRHISFTTNFKFKIIFKVIANGLATIMPNIISKLKKAWFMVDA